MLLRHFQVFFNIAGKKIICSFFPSSTHKKFPSQGDKIGWFPSQLQSELPASRRTTIFYILRQNGRGKRPQIHPEGGGGGDRNHLPFKSMLKMFWNIINTKTNPSTVTNFPASSLEQKLFAGQQDSTGEKIKRGTDSVGAPCDPWQRSRVSH